MKRKINSTVVLMAAVFALHNFGFAQDTQNDEREFTGVVGSIESFAKGITNVTAPETIINLVHKVVVPPYSYEEMKNIYEQKSYTPEDNCFLVGGCSSGNRNHPNVVVFSGWRYSQNDKTEGLSLLGLRVGIYSDKTNMNIVSHKYPFPSENDIERLFEPYNIKIKDVSDFSVASDTLKKSQSTSPKRLEHEGWVFNVPLLVSEDIAKSFIIYAKKYSPPNGIICKIVEIEHYPDTDEIETKISYASLIEIKRR
jgi:hypothetical protein